MSKSGVTVDGGAVLVRLHPILGLRVIAGFDTVEEAVKWSREQGREGWTAMSVPHWRNVTGGVTSD